MTSEFSPDSELFAVEDGNWYRVFQKKVFFNFPPNITNNHHSKYLYDKIYTIGYSGFYSSLIDTIWENGGHFLFSSKSMII